MQSDTTLHREFGKESSLARNALYSPVSLMACGMLQIRNSSLFSGAVGIQCGF
jgi:hypothetical protein